MQQPLYRYLAEGATFTYELTIRINSKTYLERLIAFEQAFLTLGEAYGMFVAVPQKAGIHLSMEPLLEKYGNERFLSIEQRKTEHLRLLNLADSKYFRNRVMYLGLDVRDAEFEDGVTVAPIDHTNELQHRAARKMMELTPGPGLAYEDLMDEFYWEEDLRVKVRSFANIWLESWTTEEGEIVDNTAIAERVTPVFNGWLKEITSLVKAENGSVKLLDAASDAVTEKGILLNGKLVTE